MKKILFPLACAIILASCTSNSEYPKFTQCLNDNHIVMFGASWCPHCAAQKQLFGRSVKDMPYFECSKNGEQVQECNDRAIISYPTWQFQESTLSKLPKEALTNLLNSELEKVRATSDNLRETYKGKPEKLKIIADFDTKTKKLIGSDISEFDKLKKLTVLAEDTDSLREVTVYTAGRISGERPLADIALYSGCNAAYQADISAAKK